MLVATEQGYDTAPMEDFDMTRARVSVGLSNRYLPVLVVCIGHDESPRFSLRIPCFMVVHHSPFRTLKQ